MLAAWCCRGAFSNPLCCPCVPQQFTVCLYAVTYERFQWQVLLLRSLRWSGVHRMHQLWSVCRSCRPDIILDSFVTRVQIGTCIRTLHGLPHDPFTPWTLMFHLSRRTLL
ncbi:hypothetical protein EXIGLDRAFT_63276 [Exidia glandulosa HHB12029]|uniref:Uncharacterized protein n=1 Tax=Exidia glandulosa HHB12029 TaxID=1314781 RepID=A0A165P0G8_EXIGL|nr:hypothetical protein EXIGLDRAFT_63276 [Exidia glandulosa HHB12029]